MPEGSQAATPAVLSPTDAEALLGLSPAERAKQLHDLSPTDRALALEASLAASLQKADGLASAQSQVFTDPSPSPRPRTTFQPQVITAQA